jgi:acyl transferase domain-containing protein
MTFRTRPEHFSKFQGANMFPYNAPSRLSYHFNLLGVNRAIDVACSSSLHAVQLALQTLRAGEADMAVCGGVTSMYTPENYLLGTNIGAASPDGRSRSFSVDANGYANGKNQVLNFFL